MFGEVSPQPRLFHYFSVKSRIPENHPMRRVKKRVESAIFGNSTAFTPREAALRFRSRAGWINRTSIACQSVWWRPTSPEFSSTRWCWRKEGCQSRRPHLGRSAQVLSRHAPPSHTTSNTRTAWPAPGQMRQPLSST